MTYFLKRLPSALLTLWLVATLVFFLTKATGAEAILGEGRNTPEIQAQIKAQWMLDKPLHVQYIAHMKKLLVLDSMESRKQRGRSLRYFLKTNFPVSMKLGLRAMFLALLVGIPIGVFCAVYHNKLIDQAGSVFALLGVSVPSFILASLVISVFVRNLNLFPATEWASGFWRMWVPAACLAAFPFAAILRLTRAATLEALREDYIRTAHAKGVPPVRVIVRHALRNSLQPVVTYVGPATAGILTGSLVVEKIFTIPGIGRFFVESVSNRDLPLIMGLTVFYCALLVGANLVVDALYPILNPKLRSQ